MLDRGRGLLLPPGLAQPSLAQPSLAQPGLAWPSLAQPSLAQPSLAWPGLAGPGLLSHSFWQLLMIFTNLSQHFACHESIFANISLHFFLRKKCKILQKKFAKYEQNFSHFIAKLNFRIPHFRKIFASHENIWLHLFWH